jgi:hypothetical protein
MFNFFPATYILPTQYVDFQRAHIRSCLHSGTTTTWIAKPRGGCCGNGIQLCQNPRDLSDHGAGMIVQRYVSPFLLDGYKFDFRFYVLIGSLNPLSAYIYTEGIARFCTEKYQAPARGNFDRRFGHLTNTAVNICNRSASTNFTQFASEVLERIEQAEGRGKHVWGRIKEVTVLTIVSLYRSMIESVVNSDIDRRRQKKSVKDVNESGVFGTQMDPLNRYFHIVGIDILLDDHLNPIVLELNDRPSLCVTFEVEQMLKMRLIYDTIHLITTDGSICPRERVPVTWQVLLPFPEKSAAEATVDCMIQRSIDEMGPRVSLRGPLGSTGFHTPPLPSPRSQGAGPARDS